MKLTFYEGKKRACEITLQEIHRSMSLREFLDLQTFMGRDGVAYGCQDEIKPLKDYERGAK